MKIIPELKRLHSPDVHDLETFVRKEGDEFCILVQAMFGQKGLGGEESFDIVACSPLWLNRNSNKVVFYDARHHIICRDFHIDAFKAHIEELAKKCDGESWKEVACKLSRIGKWEFEDYDQTHG